MLLNCYSPVRYFTNYFSCLRLSCQSINCGMLGLNRNEKESCENFRIQKRRNKFGRDTNKFSTGTLHYTQCPNFSTISRTHFSLLLLFPQRTIKIRLHFSLTRVKDYWILNRSLKLQFVFLQLTKYKISLNHFLP